MSDLSSFTGKFRVHKEGPHNSSTTKVTKRPRESFVCSQCRASKLRCDRDKPCGSCVKKQEAAACSYDRYAWSKHDGGRHTVAEDRLLHLESMVKDLMQNQTSTQPGAGMTSAVPVARPELGYGPREAVDQFRSDHPDNTKYVGYTHWSAILDDIHELKVVLGNSEDIEDTKDSFVLDIPTTESEIIFGSSNDYSLEQIISQYLPSDVEVDNLLSIYFQGETFIVPFVHTYHFRRQYREFRNKPANVSPLWLSMLFSICYLASRTDEVTDPDHPPQYNLITGRSNFHIAAGKCLVLGEYHRPQQFTVEALVMYAHCKSFKTLDPSREAGAILGMVVRMGYEMGYHRDPDSFGSFTTFEGEMRRRFWAVCKQMDLMISFQLGLPSNIHHELCDTKSPRNLLDSDFDVDTKVLPASRPENEATRLLWFIIKDGQMISFSKVCQDALSFKERSEAEILQLDEEIRHMHMAIPDVLRARSFADSMTDPPFLIMTRLYVEFISLKSLCVLHRRYMARGNAFSTRSCVEAGKSLVSQFIQMYKEFSPGGRLHKERWMLTNYTMNDFLLGVMVLCLVVHTRWKRGPQKSIIDAATESEVTALLKQSHVICVEKSDVSRDARRVSHAVSITLNGIGSSKVPGNTGTQIPLTSSFTFSSMQSAIGGVQGVDPALTSLYPQYGHIQGEEAVFGMLDPFNFFADDIENVDWSVFDSQI